MQGNGKYTSAYFYSIVVVGKTQFAGGKLNSKKSIRSRRLLYWIFIAYSWKCDENERTYDSLHYWRSRWSHIHISCGKFGR